jgi:hypothetical protein
MKSILFALSIILLESISFAAEVPAYVCRSLARSDGSKFEVVMYQQPPGIPTVITVKKENAPGAPIAFNAVMQGSRYVGEFIQFEAQSIKWDCEGGCGNEPDLTGKLSVLLADETLDLDISCESTMTENAKSN